MCKLECTQTASADLTGVEQSAAGLSHTPHLLSTHVWEAVHPVSTADLTQLAVEALLVVRIRLFACSPPEELQHSARDHLPHIRR